jgi:S-adenosylmethionine decarboxylase
MITCGQTRLVEALCLAIQTLGSDQIDLLVFERKNEFFPHLQPSRFDDDVTCIREMVPGMIAKYGHKERNHLKVFFSAKPFEPVKKDMTVEILMHNLHPQILPAFDAQGDNLERIRHQLGLWHLMEDFSIQDHLFSPRGYSLNALREHAYYTIHVTPECEGSYASFETNQHFSSNTDLKKLIEKVADTFQPADFVVILFEPVQSADFHSSWSWLPYRLVDEGIQDLDCGYRFHFYNFAKEGVQ